MALQKYTVDKSTVGGMNMLLYGNQGVGKTVFAAGAQDVPDMADVLFLNVEGGLMSIADRADITAADLDKPQDLEDLFWDLSEGKNGLEGFQTLVIDSLTELQNVDLDARADQNPGKMKGQRSLENFGNSTAFFQRVLRQFRDLSTLNVILTALPDTKYSDENQSQPTEVRPAGTPKMINSVMGYQDFVWYYYIRSSGERAILTQNTGVYRAKTRGMRFAEDLGSPVIEPTLAGIYKVFAQDAAAPAKSNA